MFSLLRKVKPNDQIQLDYSFIPFFPTLSLILCMASAIENLACTRRAAETTAPFRCAPSAPGRATGTFPRARRGRARRRSRCGRRRIIVDYRQYYLLVDQPTHQLTTLESRLGQHIFVSSKVHRHNYHFLSYGKVGFNFVYFRSPLI
jgi:hypothetical protein